MNIEDFLARLNGVESTGDGQWKACCPAHADANASMSVKVGTDGRILVHDFAGCSAEAIVGALGLKMADLMPPKVGGAGAAAGRGKGGKFGTWVCDYDYQDADGNVVYKIKRYLKPDGKKTFVMARPDPSNKYGWSFGLSRAHIKRVPFRLPRVAEAARQGKSVFIVEGEKDALNIEKLGLVATCNAGGAGKWGKDFVENWADHFKGLKRIVIIADNDPVKSANGKLHATGQRHALDVKRQLVEAGVAADEGASDAEGKALVRLMVMPQIEGRGKVKDFTDWQTEAAAAGLPCDKAAFLDVVRNAEPWPDEWAAFDENGGGVDGADDDGVEKARGGRFGVLAPTPPSSPRRYEVDFHTFGDRFETIGVGGGDDLQMAIAVACSKVMAANNGKLPGRMVFDVTAIICLMWLRARGKFFWNEETKGYATSMFFDETTGILMHVRNDEFMSFLATEANINRESTTFRYVMSMIDDAAISSEASQGVVPANLWTSVDDRIYISSGDSEMYRVSPGGVKKVQNGTDGVVFLRKQTLKPWKLVEGDGLDPFDTSMFFQLASFADDNGRMIVRLWFLNLFKKHRMKPPLLLTGRIQSGKTRMAKALKEILGTPDMSVQEAEDGDRGLDAFWATVNGGMFEIYDNLDTKIKWVANTLQIAATDGQTKRRTLYTTFGVSVLRANAHLAITSNNPMFATELGLSDRLQTVRLESTREKAADSELSKDIAEHRDEFMTWAARLLAKALADKEPVDTTINMRHPDYSTFSIRLGRVGGFYDGAVAAMTSAEMDKAVLPLQNDAIAKEILSVLVAKDGVWKFTSQEMTDAIIKRQHESEEYDSKTDEIFSCRRIGKTLSKYISQFSKVFMMKSPRISVGKTVYESAGIYPNARGLVGLVGLKADFPKSLTGNSSIDFSQNSLLNPPNPPIPFLEREEEERKDEEDDDGWSFD